MPIINKKLIFKSGPTQATFLGGSHHGENIKTDGSPTVSLIKKEKLIDYKLRIDHESKTFSIVEEIYRLYHHLYAGHYQEYYVLDSLDDDEKYRLMDIAIRNDLEKT